MTTAPSNEAQDLLRPFKASGRKLAALTAYDYPSARLLDEAGVDLLLVGDSLGMVVLGYEDTTSVTLDDMIRHTEACRRGVKKGLLISDLPYRTYEDVDHALCSARALMDAGADGVKLEGGREVLPQIQAIVESGIPLIGHLGMLPQRVREEGGYKKKGRTESEADTLVADAQALESVGSAGIVLECMVAGVAKKITESIGIPTIGIGSGKDCDGQILVTHDVIGGFPWFRPKFAKARADIAGEMRRAIGEYLESVREA